MKGYISVAVILLASIAVAPQTTVNLTEIEQIQNVVGALITNSDKADVLLKDLTEVSGYVTGLDVDWFELKTDKKKRTGMKISYDDVLAISSKKASVSFVPDPKTSPYGNWSDLKKIPANILIEITHKNGEIKAGRYRSSAADSLVLAHKEKNDEWTFSRADITFVHRVKYGWRNISGSMASGTEKGAKIGKEVGKAAAIRGPISGASTGDGRGGYGTAIGSAIGAMAGAAKGAAGKHDSLKVIIYSQ